MNPHRIKTMLPCYSLKYFILLLAASDATSRLSTLGRRNDGANTDEVMSSSTIIGTLTMGPNFLGPPWGGQEGQP